MPASLLLGLAACIEWQRTELASKFLNGTDRIVKTYVGSLEPKKKSPSGGWAFDRLSVVALKDRESESDRIRVFGQTSNGQGLSTESAATFLAALFDFNYTQLRLDHSPQFGDGCVDVYLASEGDPGGQQLFAEDPEPQRAYVSSTRVNTVYIYDVDGLTDPLETCRELAHEYGHATLPPVRIQGAPEEWVNGDLGERLYLDWLTGAVRTGSVPTTLTFGADAATLRAYCTGRIDRIVNPVVSNGPDRSAMAKGGKAGFDAYLGLAMFVSRHLPIDVFRRSLVLNPDQSATGYAKAVLDAVTERPTVEVRDRGAKSLWLPTGPKGRIEGGTVKARKNGWSLVAVKGKVRIKNPTP